MSLDHPIGPRLLAHPRAKLHLYGKRRALPRRKMGHFTVLGDSVGQALLEALAIKAELVAQTEPRAS